MCTLAHLIKRTLARTIIYQAPIDIMSEFFLGVKLRTRLLATVFGCVAFFPMQSNKLDIPILLGAYLLDIPIPAKGINFMIQPQEDCLSLLM